MTSELDLIKERASAGNALHGCTSDPCGSVVCQTARDRDELLTRLEQAEQAVARVREVHWRRTDRVGFYADSGNPIFRNVCGYCNDDHADGGGVPYPCDTIIALDGDGRE